jgi:hypothetical protein
MHKLQRVHREGNSRAREFLPRSSLERLRRQTLDPATATYEPFFGADAAPVGLVVGHVEAAKKHSDLACNTSSRIGRKPDAHRGRAAVAPRVVRPKRHLVGLAVVRSVTVCSRPTPGVRPGQLRVRRN